MNGCILMRVKPGRGAEALQAIKNTLGVRKAYYVYGQYDIVTFVEAPNYEAMSRITANISGTDALQSTETLIDALSDRDIN